MYALVVKALELLATPTGAISLVAALLAGGIAIREYRGRRNGNGHPKQPLVTGEHTGELLKDFKALGAGPVSGADVVASDVIRLEGRLDGVVSEMRAGHAELQQQIIALQLENQQQGIALEGKITEQGAALKREIAEVREKGPDETAAATIRKLRDEGVIDRRKKASALHSPERRRPDPQGKA